MVPQASYKSLHAMLLPCGMAVYTGWADVQKRYGLSRKGDVRACGMVVLLPLWLQVVFCLFTVLDDGVKVLVLLRCFPRIVGCKLKGKRTEHGIFSLDVGFVTLLERHVGNVLWGFIVERYRKV